MPARNGAEANHAKPRAEIRKLPAYLKELGYEVVAFGKVSHYKYTADYGFDSFALDGFHQHASVPAALKFLRERKSGQPLCIFVGSNWPHVPWPEQGEGYGTNRLALPAMHADTAETRHARARYYSAVTRMDSQLGQVLDTARQTLGTNTVLLHTSDHGAQFPFAKWNCYDAGIRVSLLVSWPGVIQPGTRTDAMVSWIDLLPTFVEIAGGRAPTNLDGRSFAAVLTGRTNGHHDRIFTTHSGDGNMNVYPIRGISRRLRKELGLDLGSNRACE
jgi:N-sulfoglucosamine sulfohydrolase